MEKQADKEAGIKSCSPRELPKYLKSYFDPGKSVRDQLTRPAGSLQLEKDEALQGGWKPLECRAQLEELEKLGRLVRINQGKYFSPFLRVVICPEDIPLAKCRGMREWRALLRPEAAEEARDLANICGCEESPLEMVSAVRPYDEQRGIRSAAPNGNGSNATAAEKSSHPFGGTFDLSWKLLLPWQKECIAAYLKYRRAQQALNAYIERSKIAGEGLHASVFPTKRDPDPELSACEESRKPVTKKAPEKKKPEPKKKEERRIKPPPKKQKTKAVERPKPQPKKRPPAKPKPKAKQRRAASIPGSSSYFNKSDEV